MRSAFTIIEVLVILAVLAILIGMAIPRIVGIQQNAILARAQGEIQQSCLLLNRIILSTAIRYIRLQQFLFRQLI